MNETLYPKDPLRCHIHGYRSKSVDSFELAALVAVAVAAESSPAPSGDISALPECLDGMPVVMLAHERNGPGAGYTIEDGQTGQGGASTPSATSAGDLYSFNRCALPGFGQRGQDVGPIGGQPKIWPAKPS